MIRNLSSETLTAMAAYAQAPSAMAVDIERCNLHQHKPSAGADILSIGSNPTLPVYLSGLFQKFGWTVRRSANLEKAGELLADNGVAVVICEKALPDAAWQDALGAVNALPDPPMFVLLGDDKTLLDEVLALGGFDVLTRPLREAEVIWTVASAWHEWMKRFENPDRRGTRCSDA
jgi:DNA-binding NtrC family response regulator